MTVNITLSLFLGMFLVLPSADAASAPLKTGKSARLKKEELLCWQIQDKIKDKLDIGKLVKAGVQMGYDTCGVIKCAIKNGGDPKQIIEGAVEAGTTKDVVSRCALDACAEVKDIASISELYLAKEPDSTQPQSEGPLCGEVRQKIRDRQNVREVVKTSIKMGHDACDVIRCVAKGGGEVTQAIAGAIDAGSPIDIASRCISETCSKNVAFILIGQLKQCNLEEPGLGYSLPEEPEVIIVSPLNDVNKNGVLLSPSGF